MESLINRHWNTFISIVLLAGAIWIGLSVDQSGKSNQLQITQPRTGFIAPEIELQTIQGETIRLSELRGSPVVINFWASWCSPCRQEMPAIEKVYQEYHDQGIFILGVNATNQDQLDSVIQFVDSYHLTFPILLDTQGKATQTYQIAAFPSTFFINQDGIVQEVVIGGPMAEALLLTRIEALLR